MSLFKRSIAELFGTFWLVFGGCGAVIFAAAYPTLGIGFAGISLAFGLTVLTMAFAIGHVSGCHLNPAISVGLVVAKRFPVSELPAYIISQCAGAIFASGALYAIASGKPTWVLGRFACNGYGEFSPDHYSLAACFICEVICTAFFLLIILGSTDERAPKGFAPIAIGLGLTLIHLISIPVTGTSVNPARSLGPAVFLRGTAISQLWLFWVAPIFGAIAGAVISNVFFRAPQEPVREAMSKN
jgi:aquaporin Z